MLVKIQPPTGTTWLGRRLTLKTSRFSFCRGRTFRVAACSMPQAALAFYPLRFQTDTPPNFTLTRTGIGGYISGRFFGVKKENSGYNSVRSRLRAYCAIREMERPKLTK